MDRYRTIIEQQGKEILNKPKMPEPKIDNWVQNEVPQLADVKNTTPPQAPIVMDPIKLPIENIAPRSVLDEI